MGWLTSIGVGLATGIAGLVCAGAIAAACVTWYRISSFEGASGYFVVFTALLGGIAALVLGIVVARIVAAGATEDAPVFLKGLGWSLGSVLAISAAALAIGYVLADIPPEIDGQQLRLEVELRLPAGEDFSPSASGESYLGLGSVENHTRRKAERGTLDVAAARKAGDRWIVPGAVELFTQRGLRSLDIRLGGKDREGFIIPLPARPGREYLDWSDWGPRPPAGSPPWPEARMSYRFRVQRIAPQPPGPTEEDVARAKAAEEEAEFAALAPDAPLSDWLRYTRYGTPEARLRAAIERITARPNFVAEISATMQSDDAGEAAEALRLIGQIAPAPGNLVEPVTATGRRLVEAIRAANATPVADDPAYQKFADISIRFSAWMVAARHLRAAGLGDFAPELGTMLELSRARTDSQVMQQDVRRVASYWMQQWTGLAPAPDDPRPR